MSKISKLSFLMSGISLLCLILGRLALSGWNHLLWIPLFLFLGLLIFPFFKDGKLFVDFLRMKTTKQGMSMGLMIVMVLSALILVNIIGVRKSKTWDFSTSKVNTLSEQSLQLLSQINAELKVTFFYKNGQEGTEENRRQFKDLIKKYQDRSEFLRLDFVEVNERPDLASAYGVDRGSGLVFLEYKGRKNRIEKIDEQEITSALSKVLRDRLKNVYFTTGHGELDLEEVKDGQGLNALKLLLENNNYKVQPLTMTTNSRIPEDADLVAVVGPRQNFLEHEVSSLIRYVESGGRLLIALEGRQDAGLERLLEKLAIKTEKNVVLNVVETMMGQGVNQGPTVANVFSAESPVTKVFQKQEVAVFMHPMSLTINKAVSGVKHDEIVKSPTQSMAFPDLKISGEGPMGSFTFGLSATLSAKEISADEKTKEDSAKPKSSPPGQAVVYGDASFLSNALLYQNLNRDLALNTVAALTGEENMVSIAPRDVNVTEMRLTEWNFAILLWAFLVPIPLLALAAAVGLWTRRRLA